MKKWVSVFILFLSSGGFFVTSSYAGPGYPACFSGCVGLCELLCTFSTFGAGAMPCIIPCLQNCATVCAPFICFSPSTTVVVMESGNEVEKSITDTQAGDMVKTLKDGNIVWTKVLKNSRDIGFYEYIQIDLQSSTSREHMYLNITPNHIVILRNEDGVLRVDAAKNVMVGDNMVASDGSVLSVADIKNTFLQDRYTLATSEGTVIASGVLVSTICGDVVPNGEHLFQPKMEEWYTMHESLIKGGSSASPVFEAKNDGN